MKLFTVTSLFLPLALAANLAILNSKEYLADVHGHILDQILSVRGTALVVNDLEHEFNTTLMTHEMLGLVKFHSGFVNRIGTLVLNEQKYKHIWLDAYVGLDDGFRFKDFTITFDLDCETENYKTPSVLMINFDYLEFVLSIRKNALVDEMETWMNFSSIGSFRAEGFPSNVYTEIIARDVQTKPLKDKIIETVTSWSLMLQKLLAKAAKEVPFPNLCHYCPDPPFWKS